MLEISSGIYISPSMVTAIKEADDDTCVLFLSGQDALGGMVIDRNGRELAEEISAAMGEELESVFADDEDNDEAEGDEDEEE